MNKALEALKEIREFLYGDVYLGIDKRLDIIETVLKEQENTDKGFHWKIIKEGEKSYA